MPIDPVSGEGCGSLPDQHGEAIDGGKSRRARPGQEWRIDRIGHDVIGDRTRRRMTPVECQRRLSAHSERRGIDDQIAASFAVVESEIAWPGEVVERRDVVVARGIDLVEQCARLVGVAARQHQGEAFLRQPGRDRTRRAARAQYPRHAEIVPVAQSFGEGFEKPCDIGVAAHQLAIGRPDDGVHSPDAPGQRFQPVEQRHDRLLVRHRHIAAPPFGILPALLQIGSQPVTGYMRRPVIRIEPEPLDPETVDHGGFGLADRIADDFGIGGHAGSAPSSRKAPRT